jgi:hypothetical protein
LHRLCATDSGTDVSSTTVSSAAVSSGSESCV